MEKQNSIEAALFDFDGTLVFLPTNYKRMRYKLKNLFSQVGIDSDFHPLLESINQSIFELERRDFPKELIFRTRHKAFAVIEKEELKAANDAELAQGAKETLSSLKEHGIAVAIVSRNGRACIERCLAKFGLPNPDLIVGREDAKELKPHPDHYRVALEKLAVRPNEAIIIGDSDHDIKGGNKLGIQTILVTPGEDKSIKESTNPNFKVASLLEIFGIIGLSPLRR